MRKWLVITFVLCAVFAAPKEAWMSSFGGATYVGKNITVGYTQIFAEKFSPEGHSLGDDSAEFSERIKPVVDAVGKKWDVLIGSYVSEKVYSWLSESLLEYSQFAESDKRVSVDTVNLQLNSLSFSPKLNVNIITFYLRRDCWVLPFANELGYGVFVPLIRQELLEKNNEAAAVDLVKVLMDRLSVAGTGEYGEFNEYDAMTLAALPIQEDDLAKLTKHALGDDRLKKKWAVRVIGYGSLISDPGFYAPLLESNDPDTVRSALIGLLLIPKDKGLIELRKHLLSIKRALLLGPEVAVDISILPYNFAEIFNQFEQYLQNH